MHLSVHGVLIANVCKISTEEYETIPTACYLMVEESRVTRNVKPPR